MKRDALFPVIEGTWPPAAHHRTGPWTIRDGQGGGKRVSATTADAPWDEGDLPLAEQAMAALGQRPLFLIRDVENALDQALQARGYRVVDPVVAYTVQVAKLAATPLLPMAAIPHWPPLAICETLWAEGGIGPARLDVMRRVKGPKCAILSRTHDHATGTAFVAIHNQTAMLHALEVAKASRRQGSAHNILRAAVEWAQQNGADTLAVAVTRANVAACALYASLNMQPVGHYHYRQR